MTQNSITIPRPDDWHLHFRTGDMLQAVVPHTSRVFARAIVMPNLTPPVTNAAMAASYRTDIQHAVPAGHHFTPLMTCYLTDSTDAADLIAGFNAGIFTAAKLYPAHATTNSARGVTDITLIHPALAAMEKAGMPLLVHGEVTHADIDIFDREAVFIDRVLAPVIRDFPGLKIVMEHITTKDAVDFVRAQNGRLGATITVQHLMLNRNHMLVGGIRPHYYCLPILKRNVHQLALRQAATSGEPMFFLGTDSAPHPVGAKESACGCAGVFSAPVAIECYTQVFDEENALDKLAGFASINGPTFYGLPVNTDTITLVREEWVGPTQVAVSGPAAHVVPFLAGETVKWKLSQP